MDGLIVTTVHAIITVYTMSFSSLDRLALFMNVKKL